MKKLFLIYSLLTLIGLIGFSPEVIALNHANRVFNSFESSAKASAVAPLAGENSFLAQEAAEDGSFPLVKDGKAAILVVDAKDAEVVSIVATAFSKDVKLITGVTPSVSNKLEEGTYPVIIGTLGKSALIDQLASEGKIASAQVKGKWETFCLSVIENPFEGVDKALVIFGSDPRGTAFGVFELSRQIGVSPWVWWADVLPEERSTIYIPAGEDIIGPPSVKYRGLFINDEDWGLQPWAAKKMDTDIKDIGPKTYEKVFELMLRLKANYMWPAMHPCTKAFWYYPGNPEMARKYHIVLGATHCEPLLRNNVDEWVNNFQSEYGTASGDWNWATNSTKITTYWTDRVIQSKGQDAVYTIGMRGIHDSDMPGYSGNEAKKNGLRSVIAAQRTILETHLEKPASQVPQIFCPYKEVLDLYKLGLDLPDDITITWADDNHGYIRQLSNPQEQLRSGGAGVYYHLSYWGAPEDYLWLSSISPSLISYEMSKAYALNTRNLWVFNAGDIKPAELELQFAMDLAWDITAWSPEKAHTYSTHWATETFGKELGESIGKIKQEYYHLAALGKPEHLHLIEYTEEEIDQRLADYAKLVAESRSVEGQVPSRLKDAYYELVAYPLEAAASMNEKILYAKRSLQLAAQGNRNALDYAAKAKTAYQSIITLTNKYNQEIASGKWNGIMSYAPRGRSQFSAPTVATESSIAEHGVPAEEKGNVTSFTADDFTLKHEAGYTLHSIKELGASTGSVTVWPLNMTTYNESNITSAPYVEYNVEVSKGTSLLIVKCLPTFPLYEEMKLRYAISVDGSIPEFVNIATSAESSAWTKNVIAGYASGSSAYKSDSDKEIKVRIYFTDPGLVLSALDVKKEITSPYTELITNPSFEYVAAGKLYEGTVARGTPYGWQQTGQVVGNSYGISNDATEYDENAICWYNANQSPYAMPEEFELYQIIRGLEPGEYVVRCRLAVMTGYETNVRLFANNFVQYYGSASKYVDNLTISEIKSFAGLTGVSGMTKAALREMAVKVTLQEGDSLKLGIRSSNLKSDGTKGSGPDASHAYGGFKVDHFRLEAVNPVGLKPLATEEAGIRITGSEDGIEITIEQLHIHGYAKLYSLSGNLILKRILTTGMNSISIAQKGVYLVQTVVDGREHTKKIRIE